MNNRFELFVASRYLRAKRKQAVISVITVISVLGVTLGIAVLIVVISVMTGYSSCTIVPLFMSRTRQELGRQLVEFRPRHQVETNFERTEQAQVLLHFIGGQLRTGHVQFAGRNAERKHAPFARQPGRQGAGDRQRDCGSVRLA